MYALRSRKLMETEIKPKFKRGFEEERGMATIWSGLGLENVMRPNALVVRLVFKTDCVRIDFDRDYGCDHKTGWSVALGGSYVAELEPRLWRALWMAWRYAHTSNDTHDGRRIRRTVDGCRWVCKMKRSS